MAGRKLSPMDQALVDAEAGKLKSDGKTYRQIAEAMDCSVGAAYDRVDRCYQAVRSESIKVAQDLDLNRLDEMIRVAFAEMRADRVKIDHGHVVTMPDGTPVIDHMAKLAALDRLVRIIDARTKLKGHGAPTKTTVTVLTEDLFDAEIRRYEDELRNTGTIREGSTTR